jgi:NAD(P)-dependent dehydrogenase (short-subunit alcohol dehydrogenase family)
MSKSTVISLDQQLAVVTGGGAGIGLAHARALANAGARVAIVDLPASGTRTKSLAAELADELNSEGAHALAIDLDLSSVDAGREAIRTAQEYFASPVSILVNNAGVTSKTDFMDIKDQELSRLFGVHVFAYLGAIQECLGAMRDQNFGRVINTVSEVAFGSRFGDGGVTYAAAKAAVWSMTLTIASQYANTGVTVNAISPGALTGMSAQLLSEPGAQSIDLDPKYVAQVGVWLASDLAHDVNGKIVHVAGPNVREYIGMKRTNGTPLVQRITSECGFSTHLAV